MNLDSYLKKKCKITIEEVRSKSTTEELESIPSKTIIVVVVDRPLGRPPQEKLLLLSFSQ